MTFWSSSSLTVQVTGIMISGMRLLAFLDQFAGGLEDGADLHLGDLGIGDAQAHAAVTEHRVVLAQALGALLELRVVDLEFLAQGFELVLGCAARTRAAAGRAGGW